MFLISKLVAFLLDPATILLLLLLLAAVLHMLGRRRWATRLFLGSAALALAVAVLPVGALLIAALEDRFSIPRDLPDTVDGIVVLGGAVTPTTTAARGQVTLSGSAERIVAFVRLARRYPGARLVYTAGSGDPLDQRHREADAVRPLLSLMGLDTARVLFERDSRNTFENARKSRAMAGPEDGERWILITSARHMPRAVGTFRGQDWPVIPYPVDYETIPEAGFPVGFDLGSGLVDLRLALHEWAGLLGYYLLGRTASVFPGPAE